MARQCEQCKQLDKLEAAVNKLSDQEVHLLHIAAQSLYFADSSDYKAALQSIVATILVDGTIAFSEITSDMMKIINPKWPADHEDS